MERRQREWEDADEEERRQLKERMRADRERWAADAKRNQAQLADKLEADGVLCQHGHEMTKCESLLDHILVSDHILVTAIGDTNFDPLANCSRCGQRNLIQSCDYFYHCTTCSRWPPRNPLEPANPSSPNVCDSAQV